MRKALAFFGIIVLVCAASALAVDVKVDIPFSFIVGNKTLSPGEYIFTGNAATTRIRNMDQHVNVFMISDYSERTSIPKVTINWSPTADRDSVTAGLAQPTADSQYRCAVFTKQGDKYFLSRIWAGFQGRKFPEGEIERQLKSADLYSEPQTVVLAAPIH